MQHFRRRATVKGKQAGSLVIDDVTDDADKRRRDRRTIARDKAGNCGMPVRTVKGRLQE
jgi:geranylgeranyl pyrophosphate synthase